MEADVNWQRERASAICENAVFCTDWGRVRLGPKFLAAYKMAAGGMAKSPRSKAYKGARAETEKIELLVCELSRLYWTVGSVLEKTP